jgi:hypothetical protein
MGVEKLALWRVNPGRGDENIDTDLLPGSAVRWDLFRVAYNPTFGRWCKKNCNGGGDGVAY